MKIAFDVDGVILDFYGKVFPNFTGKVPDWNCPNLRHIWHQIKDDVDIWCNLEKILNWENINFDFDLYLTAIDPKYIECRKYNLINMGWPEKLIVASDDKVNYCLNHDIDILIDDKPSTILEAKTKGLKFIQFYPYFADWEIIDDIYVAKNEVELNNLISKIRNEIIEI